MLVSEYIRDRITKINGHNRHMTNYVYKQLLSVFLTL